MILTFSKALIPYTPRNESSLKKAGYNEYRYLTCPNNCSLAMKYHGMTKEKGPLTVLNGDAPKCATKRDAGFVSAIISAVLPGKAAPLTHTKT